jgi:hypothetical protein
MLGDIKDGHGDIECVGHQKNCHPHLEEVFEETEAVPVMQVVLFGDHGDQLVAKHEGDDHACDRDDHCLGQRPDHAEDVAVPPLRGLSDLFGDRGCLFVDINEHSRQVAFDQPNEELPDGLLDLV